MTAYSAFRSATQNNTRKIGTASAYETSWVQSSCTWRNYASATLNLSQLDDRSATVYLTGYVCSSLVFDTVPLLSRQKAASPLDGGLKLAMHTFRNNLGLGAARRRPTCIVGSPTNLIQHFTRSCTNIWDFLGQTPSKLEGRILVDSAEKYYLNFTKRDWKRDKQETSTFVSKTRLASAVLMSQYVSYEVVFFNEWFAFALSGRFWPEGFWTCSQGTVTVQCRDACRFRDL